MILNLAYFNGFIFSNHTRYIQDRIFSLVIGDRLVKTQQNCIYILLETCSCFIQRYIIDTTYIKLIVYIFESDFVALRHFTTWIQVPNWF